MVQHHTRPRGSRREVLDRLTYNGAHVDGLASAVRALVVGVQQQVVDQSRHALGGPEGHPPGRPEVLRPGLWIGHDHVQVGAQHSQRVTQLV